MKKKGFQQHPKKPAQVHPDPNTKEEVSLAVLAFSGFDPTKNTEKNRAIAKRLGFEF